jgi:hypothetical protein
MGSYPLLGDHVEIMAMSGLTEAAIHGLHDMEAFCSRARRHSPLGGLSSEAFEPASIWGSIFSAVEWEVQVPKKKGNFHFRIH